MWLSPKLVLTKRRNERHKATKTSRKSLVSCTRTTHRSLSLSRCRLGPVVDARNEQSSRWHFRNEHACAMPLFVAVPSSFGCSTSSQTPSGHYQREDQRESRRPMTKSPGDIVLSPSQRTVLLLCRFDDCGAARQYRLTIPVVTLALGERCCEL